MNNILTLQVVYNVYNYTNAIKTILWCFPVVIVCCLVSFFISLLFKIENKERSVIIFLNFLIKNIELFLFILIHAIVENLNRYSTLELRFFERCLLLGFIIIGTIFNVFIEGFVYRKSLKYQKAKSYTLASVINVISVIFVMLLSIFFWGRY